MRSYDLKPEFPALVALLSALLLSACEGGRSEIPPVRVAGGDPQRGAAVIKEIGCGACHHIPGIDEAEGVVGPPLTFWSRRSFIAGNVPNSAPNLIKWIRNPDRIEPSTAMPNLGIGEQEARDIAAYLYTLE